jgi:hypothetical protein
MKDPEGFAKAMDEVFDKIKDELASLRVYFRENDAVITADAHVMGGRLFDPQQLICPYGTLPDFITSKIAMLRIAGRGVYVDGIGTWRKDSADDKMYYIKATPKQWNEFAKGVRK